MPICLMLWWIKYNRETRDQISKVATKKSHNLDMFKKNSVVEVTVVVYTFVSD